MNIYLRAAATVISVLVLAACGSNSQVTRPMESLTATMPTRFIVGTVTDSSGKAVPSHIVAALKGHLESQLKQRKLAPGEGENAALVNIDITGYRMRGGVSRAVFGVMAGKDGIASKVTVTAPDDPTHVIGESTVSTFNVLAVGGEDDIPRMHAEEIVKFLAGEKEKPKKH